MLAYFISRLPLCHIAAVAPNNFQKVPCRFLPSFANSLTAEELWKSVTSKSAAGKKRTGGKRGGTKKRTDLNKGQVIGMGEKGMIWPGLNSPVVQGTRAVSRSSFEPDSTRMDEIFRMRNRMGTRRRTKLAPLERGWAGTRFPGMKMGPPDPIGEHRFEGFQSIVLMFRMTTRVSGIYGRIRGFEAMVGTGNGNGCFGFALARSSDQRKAVHLAKNRAAQQLLYIERKNDHTILHDYWEQYHRTYVYARRQPEGHGLVCHRVIKAICELVGIKDLWAKVLGRPRNYVSVTQAFVNGLLKQKTHQQLADETGLLVVEQAKDSSGAAPPRLLAEPSHGIVRTKDEIGEEEELNVDKYSLHGVYLRLPKKFEPFFANYPGTKKRIFYDYRRRNQKLARLQRRAQASY